MAAKIFNKTGQDGTSEATGINSAFLMWIVIGMIAFFLLPVLGVSVVGTKIISMIGIIFIVAGVGLLVAYMTTKVAESIVYDEPYSLCQPSEQEGQQRTTWGSSKSQLKQSKKYVAVDFYPDNLEVDTSKIKDDALGLAVFLTVAEYGDKSKCTGMCTPDSEKAECRKKDVVSSRSITMTLSSATNWQLYIGIIAIVVGVLQIGFGMYMSKSSDVKNQMNNQDERDSNV
jgi:hypothetical protein